MRYNTRTYDSLDDGRLSGTTSEDFWNRGDWMRWNKAEEREFEMLQGPPAVKPTDWNKHLIYLDEPAYSAILQKNEEIARTHAEIGRQFLDTGKPNDWFNRKWTEVSVEDRIVAVVQGLRHSTQITGGWQACVRISTPDLTVDSMAKDEAGFISILRHMVNSHIEHPNQDGYNEWIDPTGTFDRFYGIDRTGQVPLHRAIRNSQAAINGDRQVYCARFVFGVLLALGEVEVNQYRIPEIDLPRLEVRNGRNVTRGINQAGPRIDERNIHLLNVDGSQSQKDVDREIAITRRLEEGMTEMCAACYRIRDEVEELVESGGKMSHCSKCLKVNRRIAYCSASCQAFDWPRHKREVYCGKLLSKVLEPPTFPPAPSVPPPTLQYLVQFDPYDKRRHNKIYSFYVEGRSKSGRLNGCDMIVPFLLKEGSPEIEEFTRLRDGLRTEVEWEKLVRFTEILSKAEDEGRDKYSPEKELSDRTLIEQVGQLFENVDVKALAAHFNVTLPVEKAKKKVGAVEQEQVKLVEKENLAPSNPASSTTKKKKKNKKKNKKSKNKKSTSSTSPHPIGAQNESDELAFFREQIFGKRGMDDDEEDSEFDDSDDDFECNCGLAHHDGPGGVHEWKSWLPKNEDASLEDIIQGLSAFTAESERRSRQH
ncbi:hypothetical protein JCM5350_007622 [Sporobolomyces pararoseus]